MPSDKKVIAMDRAVKALAMRRSGMTYQQIASVMGYAQATSVHKIVQKALRDALVEAGTEELRMLELARLDEMQAAIWQKAQAGDLRAIDTVLRVMERRARMLGIDAPERQEISGPDGGPLEVQTEITLTHEERVQRVLEIVRGAQERQVPSTNGHTNGHVPPAPD